MELNLTIVRTPMRERMESKSDRLILDKKTIKQTKC